MFELENFTCFHTQQFKNVDQLDRAYDVVVAKVSYEFEIDPATGQTELQFARTQTPLTFADTFYGEPSQTTTLLESDFSLYKPKVDIVVNATAYAPDDRMVGQFPVSVQIGDYEKPLAVTGPRYWVREALGWTLGEASPIDSLPIRYEFAFGGSEVEDDHEGYQENAIGMGYYPKAFLQKNSAKRMLPAHQIYNPAKPVRDPSEIAMPEGFGFFPRYFARRARHTGTADAEWIEKRAPLLPEDFSMAYWNGAHPSLQLQHFKPNHIYEFGFTGLVHSFQAPNQHFTVSLPVETVFAHVYTPANLSLCKDLILDTVVVDVEKRRIDCTYRTSFPEELEVVSCQLRFIARHERGAQIELAKECKASKSQFTPIPPSLMAMM
ncbi:MULTISPECIES: DUF2169 domain-containing protein [unclassified Neisseria]|uniref:DUF2169 family type VI secretion system accessory protein n=1 Tax=unclassified Neisseria TaxID=2623750 RepID=UPI002666CE3D|nr:MULTISPECIES: DUF2169 domain-containing protein [unclassified Neisseria]MDO1510494.1 DUF2169 domain-containing protein [Neisseria sp. MVDL19-042950]MDO1516663.1 DUF2169 domain-containing protein [Neisseria sp. MVDL18-041461]MDO1563809.1 DUF2169 domain-containing protein [Neisseria sp. MVDL20-010259]